jgi:hypothetical protein
MLIMFSNDKKSPYQLKYCEFKNKICKYANSIFKILFLKFKYKYTRIHILNLKY